MHHIGDDRYDENNEAYTQPSKNIATKKQFREFVRDRLAYVDSCVDEFGTVIKCADITLSESSIEIANEGHTLTATLVPSATTQEVVWESSNTSIATVEDGVVTGVRNGSATITATCGQYSATCSVTVSSVVEPDEPDVPVEPGVLPADYTALSYIESSGTQYIDTGVNGGENAAYEIKFDTLGKAAVNWEQYFCGDELSKIPKIFYAPSGSVIGIASSFGESPIAILLKEQVAGASVYAYTAEGKIYLDGSVNSVVASVAGKGWGTLTWYVCNSHGEPNLMSSMRLYYLKMWTDDVLVRYFVPAIRNSDNVAGLYDLANGVFYTNNGTGSFAYA